MKYTNLIFITFLFFACKDSSKINTNEINSTKSVISNSTTCQLIEKEFMNKIGKSTGVKEFYLRCSIQDYFIKFCESDVTSKELNPF